MFFEVIDYKNQVVGIVQGQNKVEAKRKAQSRWPNLATPRHPLPVQVQIKFVPDELCNREELLVKLHNTRQLAAEARRLIRDGAPTDDALEILSFIPE